MGRVLATVLIASCLLIAAASDAVAFETPVDRVATGGVIMDVSPTKILYRDPDGSSPTGLHIQDRATGAVEDLPPGRFPILAFLSPHGAIWTAGVNQPNVNILEWRDGVLLDHGRPVTDTVLRAAGNYAAWIATGGPGEGLVIRRRDLAAGTTLQFGTQASNTDVEPSPNGDVYWHAYPDGNPDIFRWREGLVQQLTDDAYWNYSARTDGVNVAYTKAVNSGGSGDKASALMTPSGEEILLDTFRPENAPGPDYDLAGGWTVFSRVGPAGDAQAWRRSPSGVTSQVSPTQFGSWFFRGIGANGDVWLGSPYTLLVKAGGQSVDLGSSYLGDTRARGFGYTLTFLEGGAWFVARGDTIYEISTGYPRPKGATPTRMSLVLAYKPCNAPNRVHGPPLAFNSCTPPQQESNYLTVGTPDSNARLVKAEGSITFTAIVGNPATPADEADLGFQVTINDVRRKDNLEDYTGKLLLDGLVRATDRNTQSPPGGTTHGTTGDFGFPFAVPCTPTADTSIGSTCSLTTTLDAAGPFIKEGARAVWELQQVRLYDGGVDGDADPPGAGTLFAVPGVFVP